MQSLQHPASELATKQDLRAEIADLRAEMHEMYGRVQATLRAQTVWFITAVAIIVGVAQAIGRLV